MQLIKITHKSSQRGSLLIESLVIISILAILAVIAVPNVNNLLLRKDISTARETLVQSLKLARQQAQAENTVVNVTLQGHEISIQTTNRPQTPTRIVLPQRVQLASTENIRNLQLAFNPNGTIDTANANVFAIVIQPSNDSNSGLQESVQINALGNIAGM
jgi:Tfp pilus assembly protein FimT